MGGIPLAKTPDVAHDHPAEDSSEHLTPLGIHRFQMIIGRINWIATLGRICIAYAASQLAHFSAGQREENLVRVLRIMCYLKKRPNLELAFDPTEMHQTNNGRAANRKELMA